MKLIYQVVIIFIHQNMIDKQKQLHISTTLIDPFLQVQQPTGITRWCIFYVLSAFSTLKPRQNGRYFSDDIFKCIFLKKMKKIDGDFVEIRSYGSN